MSERIKPTSEHEPNQPEREAEAERPKPTAETDLLLEQQQEMLESARSAANQESATSRAIKLETEPPAATKISKHDKNRAYKQTIGLVQAGLPKASRSFSRIIHQPAVARLSEAAEKTVARPKAMLGAGLTATVGLAVMLFFARRYGFHLSGSEFFVLLGLGWFAGLVLDLLLARRSRRA
jgi:hypothetical protein